jgi:uncharacterized protein YoaH (UPF0181 family)
VGFYASKNALGITERQVLHQIEKIRELRSQGVSDGQIMQQMNYLMEHTGAASKR